MNRPCTARAMPTSATRSPDCATSWENRISPEFGAAPLLSVANERSRAGVVDAALAAWLGRDCGTGGCRGTGLGGPSRRLRGVAGARRPRGALGGPPATGNHRPAEDRDARTGPRRDAV